MTVQKRWKNMNNGNPGNVATADLLFFKYFRKASSY